MARDTELRSRVMRLLEGEYRPDDLTRLFLWLRDRSYGMGSIREIGDFVAHSDERNKGLVTEDARDFFRILRIRPPSNDPIDLSDVPADFCLAVKGNFHRIEPSTIKQQTGLRRKAAEATLNAALLKFRTNQQSGRKYLQWGLTQEELAVLNCVLGTIVVRPVFTDETLFRDFLYVLEKNKSIQSSERPNLIGVKTSLALFAIAHMHHTELLLDDGWSASLYGGHSEGRLQVRVIAPTWPIGGGASLLIAASMFDTNLKPEDWCSSELLAFPDGGQQWHCSIEVTAEPRLVAL